MVTKGIFRGIAASLACMLVMLALAAPACAEETLNSIIELEVGTLFRVTFNLTNPTFTPTEMQVIANDKVNTTLTASGGSWDNLITNVWNTKVNVRRTNWTKPSGATAVSDFKLSVKKHASEDGALWKVVPIGPTTVQIAQWDTGVIDEHFELEYQLSDVNITDIPGSYSCTVTYTMTAD